MPTLLDAFVDLPDPRRLVASRDHRVAVFVSGGLGTPSAWSPARVVGPDVWWLPPDRGGGRLGLGIGTRLYLGEVSTISAALPTWQVTGRGAVWWGDRWSHGPQLGLGALWRVTPGGLQAGPLGTAGWSLRRRWGPMLASGTVGSGAAWTRSGLALLPSAELGVGAEW